MSELKAYNVVASSETENYICGETNLAFEAYDADDVDALLAEKDAQILDLIEQVQKERSAKVDYKISANDLSDGLKKAHEEIRHSKYKRCLAMAEWCHEAWANISTTYQKAMWYRKWYEYWRELAEKFKEAK